MQIIHFTPIEALLGGALIGLGAAVLLLTNGKLMGASGILKNTIMNPKQSQWRWLFLISMLVTAIMLQKINPAVSYIPALEKNHLQIMIFSILVGLGASIGSGCTSGHGICGLPRLSIRSLVAVLLFMTSAFVTANLLGVLNV